MRRETGTNAAVATTYYVYAGAQPILEYSGSLKVTATNVYGLGVDELLVRDTGTPLFYHQDRLGSVSAVSNGSGQIAEQYVYDVWGTPEIRSARVSGSPRGSILANTYVSNRFMFTGREWAAGDGFYEYRARAYQPKLGRFMSEDPDELRGRRYEPVPLLRR